MANPARPLVSIPEPQLLDPDKEDLLLYKWLNVMFVYWLAPVRPASVARLSAAMQLMCERHPEGFSSVVVIPDHTGLPDAAAREALMNMVKERNGPPGDMAIVIQGGFLFVSAVRGVVTAMHLFERQRHRLDVHRTFEEAAASLPAIHFASTRVELRSEELLSALRRAAPAQSDSVRTNR